MEKVNYSYEDFQTGINVITRWILDDNYRPDYIVGVVRGGAIPGIYLSHRLGIPIQLVHWATRDIGIVENEDNCWIPEDLVAGKKILIIEDIIDSGLSIASLKASWQKSVFDLIPQDAIKIAALWYNKDNPNHVKCDFYHKKHNREWITFPWEI